MGWHFLLQVKTQLKIKTYVQGVLSHFSRVRPSATPWAMAHQAQKQRKAAVLTSSDHSLSPDFVINPTQVAGVVGGSQLIIMDINSFLFKRRVLDSILSKDSSVSNCL